MVIGIIESPPVSKMNLLATSSPNARSYVSAWDSHLSTKKQVTKKQILHHQPGR